MADLVGWLSGLETLVSVVYIYIYIYITQRIHSGLGPSWGQVPQGETGEGPKIVFYVFLVFSRILKVCQGMLRCFHEDKGPRGLNHICFECHSGS